MSIIPQKKGNRKSDESNFYFSVLLSKNLYPEIVRMERFEICWRYIHILKIASSGYEPQQLIFCIYHLVILNIFKSQNCTFLQTSGKTTDSKNLWYHLPQFPGLWHRLPCWGSAQLGIRSHPIRIQECRKLPKWYRYLFQLFYEFQQIFIHIRRQFRCFIGFQDFFVLFIGRFQALGRPLLLPGDIIIPVG